MTQPIELYYWPTPNGHKIAIFLEESGLPYELHYINIGRGEQFAPHFLRIAPNNRMPAIVDPDGPLGQPLSVFESGAILQYLGRKTGQFYPQEERKRVEVDQWLMWQMAGVGPMLGQFHHFHHYAEDKLPYAMQRYADEAHRLYGVLNQRLSTRAFVADDYSIADMAIFPWTRLYHRHGIAAGEFPHLERWVAAIAARPAVKTALALGAERRANLANNQEAKRILFGQRAR